MPSGDSDPQRPPCCDLDWTHQYRIVSSEFPPINLVYRSVRDPGGECIAALRPPAVTIPRQGPHLSYVWDGARIVRVYRKTLIQSS